MIQADDEATAKIGSIIKQIESTDFHGEYSDVAVRNLVERITVVDKGTVVIRFRGGFEFKAIL